MLQVASDQEGRGREGRCTTGSSDITPWCQYWEWVGLLGELELKFSKVKLEVVVLRRVGLRVDLRETSGTAGETSGTAVVYGWQHHVCMANSSDPSTEPWGTPVGSGGVGGVRGGCWGLSQLDVGEGRVHPWRSPPVLLFLLLFLLLLLLLLLLFLLLLLLFQLL